MLARLAAASCFLCVAFSWVPAFMDRAGLAALGMAFLAFAVGRATVGVGSPLPTLGRRGANADLEAAAAEAASIVGRIHQYEMPAGDRARNAGR